MSYEPLEKNSFLTNKTFIYLITKGIFLTSILFLSLVLLASDSNYHNSAKLVNRNSAIPLVSPPPPNLNNNSCNNILNPEFNGGTDDWYMSTQPADTATFSIDATSQVSGTNSAFADITTASGTSWHIQLSQSGVSIINGTTYYIQFKAKAAAARGMWVRLQQVTSPYTTYYSKYVLLTTASKEYGNFSFTSVTTDPNVVFKFEMGESSENIYIDDVVFGEVDCYHQSEYTDISSAVSSSSDDAEEDTGTGVVTLTNGAVYHNASTVVGTRFNNINIPQGASIIDAYVAYEVNGPMSNALDLTVKAEAIDNATTFTSTANDISGRTTTSNTGYWSSVEEWTSTGETRFSTYIGNVVQEIIDRPGWVSGNSIALLTQGGTGERSAVSYDQAIGGEPILHIAFTTGEVCNNGIDDDGDGLIDCADCADCSTISVCYDIDNDEVGHFCDLDDDNDGIPDTTEYMCNSFEINAAEWHHNTAPYDTSYLSAPYWIDTLYNEVEGSGIGVTGVTSRVTCNGIDQTDLSGAISDNDYLEYGFTTASGVEAFYLSNMRAGVHGTVSSGSVPDNYGYDIAVLISNNNFSTYTTLESQYTFSSTVGTTYASVYFGIDDNFHYLTPATDYQIRIYFFNKTTSGAVDAWFDDFAFYITGCNEVLDTDGDGVYNHMDLDSDNDGIYDVDEAGHGEPDIDDDGRIDGVPSTFGANGLFNGVETVAESNILNYAVADSETSPDGRFDAYELDSDGDSCFDAFEESVYDPDYDGIAGSGVAGVNANGLKASITFRSPPFNNWQNPAAAHCLPEICGNSIDDDGDGLIDCADDECSLCDASCGDNDNDGIGDICDIDDDNDGILDDVEALELNTYLDSAECTIPFINFSGPVLESGTDNQVNAIYRYTNVSSGTDALVTIVSLSNALLNSIDDETGSLGFIDAFQPRVHAISPGLAGAEINFKFVDTGTSTLSTTISRVGGTFYDIDGTTNISQESVQFGYPAVIGWDSPTLLNISNPATGWEITANGTYEGTGIDPDPRLRIYFVYQDTNQFTVKFQQFRQYGSGTRFFSMRFDECEATDFENLQLLILEGRDHDNDGVDNHLDLDSDNDGIYDLNEAGHTATDANEDGIIDGIPIDFGDNGLFDGLETYADSDTVNYILADSEASRDSIYDFFELDSDGDGCFDAREGGVVDGDSDGIAGSGVPTVDANGLVTTIIYAAPVDTFWRNPVIAVCNTEICNDAIDNDGDGLIDINDPDCCQAQAPVLTKQ